MKHPGTCRKGLLQGQGLATHQPAMLLQTTLPAASRGVQALLLPTLACHACFLARRKFFATLRERAVAGRMFWNRNKEAGTKRHFGHPVCRWYDNIVAASDDIATIMTMECGKPLAEARAEIASGWVIQRLSWTSQGFVPLHSFACSVPQQPTPIVGLGTLPAPSPVHHARSPQHL